MTLTLTVAASSARRYLGTCLSTTRHQDPTIFDLLLFLFLSAHSCLRNAIAGRTVMIRHVLGALSLTRNPDHVLSMSLTV